LSAPEKNRTDGSSERGARTERGELRQTLFREVNEQIERLSGEWLMVDRDTVLCECGHPDCLEQIEVSAEEYEAVRLFPTRFLVKPKHVAPEGERVVHETVGYVVVEKLGPGAETAIRSDPRRAPHRDRETVVPEPS